MTLTRQQIRSILSNPLDGIQIRILDHTDTSLIDISGIIKSETRHMLIIDLDDNIIMVNKSFGIYTLCTDLGCFDIVGPLLDGKAKRRNKRKLRHW